MFGERESKVGNLPFFSFCFFSVFSFLSAFIRRVE